MIKSRGIQSCSQTICRSIYKQGYMVSWHTCRDRKASGSDLSIVWQSLWVEEAQGIIHPDYECVGQLSVFPAPNVVSSVWRLSMPATELRWASILEISKLRDRNRPRRAIVAVTIDLVVKCAIAMFWKVCTEYLTDITSGAIDKTA